MALSPEKKKLKIDHMPIDEPFDINSLLTYPGYSLISQKILWNLDHKSHLTFRLVCRSWKNLVDRPYFWLTKCVQKGMAEDLKISWTDLLQKVEENSFLEKDFRECLMKWYGNYHFGTLYHQGVHHKWKKSGFD